MPAVAAAAAAAFSAVVGVFTGATTVAAAAASVAAVGSTVIVAGITVSQAYTALTAVTAIYSATRKPKIDGGGQMLDFKADPNAPNVFMLGRTATGGNVVFGTTHGDNNNFLTYGVVLSCAGPIDAIEQFYADDKAVTFTGQRANGTYNDRMWQARHLGGIQAAALNITQNDNKWSPIRWNPLLSTWWTANHKLSGKAHFLWTMHTDTKLYGGVPKPTTVGRGIKVYDRRKDSTAGGVGTQRWNDPSTWAYSVNPYVHATTFLLGYYEKAEDGSWVRVGGCGLTPDVIDWPSYIEGMNIADANSWKVSGNIHTGMNKWAVLSSMLQAGGGLPLHKGAMISCSVMSPKVSVATITDNDLLVQGTIDAGALKRERFNTGIPRIRSEAAFWQVAPLAEKTNTTYRIEDGKRIAKEVSFDLVAGGADAATQAGQLTAYAVAENREGIQITVTVGPKFADVRAGSAVTANTPSLGVVGQKMVVVRRRFDPRRFMWTLTLRSETDAKHGWALGQTTAEPATPVLNDTDGMTVPAPNATDWVVSAPNAGNNRLPFIRVSLNPALDGTPTDRNAVAIIIDYRPVDGAGNALGEWASAEYPINAIIDHPVQALTRYEVKLRYRYPRNQQDPAVTTAPVYVTSSAAVVDDVAPGGGLPPADVAGVPGLSISTVIQPDGTQISRLSASCAVVDGAASYVVQIDNGTTAWTEAVAGPAVTNLVVPTGPTYKVRFKAVSRTGVQSVNWSSYSAAQVSTGDFTGPGAITVPTVTALMRRNVLSWTNPVDPDYSHLKLFRNLTGALPNVEGAAYQERINGSVFPDTNVTAGTTYYYFGMTIDRTGNRGPLTYMGQGTPSYASRGEDYGYNDPVLVTEVGTSALVYGQSPWVTDTSRTPSHLAAAIDTSGFLTSGIRAAGGLVLPREEIFAGMNGTQLSRNPEFQGGSDFGYGIYDNATSGKTTMAIQGNSFAPNASKYHLQVTYDGTGVPDSFPGGPTPGYGGIVQNLYSTSTPYGPGYYRRGSKVLLRIKASIPVGRQLNFHTNGLGDGGTYSWLSSQEGTGGFFTYLILLEIGVSGSFGTTGYLAVHGGPNTAFSWYVAVYDQLDVTSAQSQFLIGLQDQTGAPQNDYNLITSQGTAALLYGQGAWATAVVPGGLTPGVVGNRTQRFDNASGVADANTIYYTNGQYVDTLRPLEFGSNVTENRTAALVANQGYFATQNNFNWNDDRILNRPAFTQGNGLTEDQAMRDPTAWDIYSSAFYGAAEGGWQGAIVNNLNQTGFFNSRRSIPVDRNKTYMVEGYVYANAGGPLSTCYGGVSIEDGAGNYISGDGTYWLYSPASQQPPLGINTYYSRLFGAGTSRPLPTNATTMRVIGFPNYGNQPGAQHYFNGWRIVEVVRIGSNLYRMDGTLATEPMIVTDQGTSALVANQSGWVTTTVPLTRVSRMRDNGRAVNSYQASNGLLTNAGLTRTPIYILGSSVQSGAARVSISAHSITGSGVSASYSAGTIDGLAFSTIYYVWAYDPDVVGGAVTYVATSDPNSYINNADYLFLDSITTVQSSGDLGYTPPPPRPPGYTDCVVLDAWLPNLKQARDIRAGDALLMLRPDGEGMEPGTVEGWRIGLAPVMRFETVSGIRLTCSTTTPIPHLVGGEVKYKTAWECTGEEVMAVVDGEGFRWEKLAKQPGHIGEMAVALISAHNGVYAAGDQRDRFIFTHNILYKRETTAEP